MSTTKVIFTYKRKRLSSCSGVDHADVFPDYSSDAQTGKHQGATKGRPKILVNDLTTFKCDSHEDVEHAVNSISCLHPCSRQCSESHQEHICHEEKLSSACSPPQVHMSGRLKEKNHVQRCDTSNTREMILVSHEFSEESAFKTSGENISIGASLGKTTNSIKEDSCLDVDSNSSDLGGCMQAGLVSQSVEKESISKRSNLSNVEIGKAKLTAPLRTFSRRLKRKADAGLFSELPIGVSCCSCEVTSNKSNTVEESVDLKVASDAAKIRNVFCESKEKISEEVGYSPCRCTGSCTILRHTKGKVRSEEDLVASPDLVETTNLSKDNVGCSSNDGILVSYCDDTCKTDEKPASHQLRASSGDSQLTSCDGSDSKIIAPKTEEHNASSAYMDFSRPPPGAFVIDCNVIPESDFQEVSEINCQDSLLMVENHGNLTQKAHLKSKGLELFGDTCVQAEDVHASVEAETKQKNKFLQLFSEDGKSTCSDIGCSKTEQNPTFALDTEGDFLHQSPSKPLSFLGLSLPTERIPECQTSNHGSSMQPFNDSKFRTREFIPDLGVQSFSDHGSLMMRHKILLESINTRATALRGNRNISLDKFEPCPIMWSEEELDSLWIGIRRHGRGNWHAMLLDPRLNFAPWRVARDLADQWEHEHYKLFSGQHMPSGRYLKPQGPYNMDNNGGLRLSLGDVYAQQGGPYKRMRTGRGKVRNFSVGLLNNLQRGESPTMGLATNNLLPPHWLREPFGPPSGSLDPHQHQFSALTQMEALRHVLPFPEPSGTCCGPRKLIDDRVAGLMAGGVQPPMGFNYGSLSMRKQGMTDNLIVIDSDASSEETISDDHNITG